MAEKRPQNSSDRQSKKLRAEPICCLKSCSTDLGEEDRAEVKTCLPSKTARSALPSGYVVEWNSSGEACFHRRCWVELLRNARVRNQKRATIRMTDEEKRLVKEAAKTVEFHDSSATLIENAKQIASLIRSTRFCVAFTGAGISTSAGIGDYRGKSGKWTEQDRDAAAESTGDQDEEEEEGVPYERLRPTYTHEALSKLIEMGLLKHVISQNGDGLHSLSGIPADKLSELHGNVFLEVCEECSCRYYRPYYVLDDSASLYFEELNENGKTSILKPRHAVQCSQCELCHRTGRKCTQPGCKGHLLDSIINFGDNLEEDILDKAEQTCSQADFILSLGTTMQVTPACDLVLMGKKPLRLAIVNRQITNFDNLCMSKDGKEQLGVRAFGDCDALLREVMRQLLTNKERVEWEQGRVERLKMYDTQRKTD